jgi:hypothetical protein
MTLEAIDPLPRTRRGWIALGVAAVVVMTAFVLVVRFYNVEGGSVVDGGLAPADDGGVVASIEPLSVNADEGVSRIHVTLLDRGSGLVDENERLTENLRLTVTTGLGPVETRFPAGTLLGQTEVEVRLTGEAAAYPFDEHGAFMTLMLDGYDKEPDGSLVSIGDVPLGLSGSGGVNGWDTTMTLTPGFREEASAGLAFERAFSTIVFALLILTISAVLGLLALIVGLRAFAGRRVTEAAMLGWSAALLFALPALRNYLPNGPPFGAAIDMYAFLWIMVAAGVAAMLLVVAHSAQPGASARPRKDEVTGGAA